MNSMNARERVIAIIAGLIIVVVGGGFLGYLFVYVPFRDKSTQVTELEREVSERKDRVRNILAKKDFLKMQQKYSLPADVDLARREYERELNTLLRAAEFAPGAFTILSRAPDTTSGPKISGKKPVYTKLEYNIRARGDLMTLVDFLDRFYHLRLLHQIRNFSVQRSVTQSADRRSSSTDLEIDLRVEALVLDSAEKRTTLLPKDAAPPTKLAAIKRDYLSIAGKNPFFGVPPPPVVQRPEAPEDIRRYIKLTDVTRSDLGLSATLYDVYHNYFYEIRPSDDGFRTQVVFFLGDRKKTLQRAKETFTLVQENGWPKRVYQIAALDENSLTLRASDEKEIARRAVLGTFANLGLAIRAFNPIEPIQRAGELTIKLGIGNTLEDAPVIEGERRSRFSGFGTGRSR